MKPKHELQQWINTVAMRFPSISKPQAAGLALWSFGMILARSCSLTAVACLLAPLQGLRVNDDLKLIQIYPRSLSDLKESAAK